MNIFLVVMSLLWIVIDAKTVTEVQIGVILDMDSGIGKMSNTCISMAIHDFYRKHDNYTTVIRPHFRDSKQDNVEAASAAIDLLKNVQVTAILGPMTSSQADFVIDIGEKSKVPIISPATSPCLSPDDNLYFIRSAHDSSSQVRSIADLIKHFGWREIVFIYEDGEYGRGLGPYLSDAMRSVDTKITHRTIIYPSVSDDWILAELYKLKTMQTRVFVVHALPPVASRLFKKVSEAGMMEDGYAWIITEGLTARLNSLDQKDIDLMQGVLGVKSFIPRSTELINFERRWKREFQSRNPEDDVTELDLLGIWLYDTVFGLATAVEKIGNEMTTFKQEPQESATDLDAIGTSETGSKLHPWIRNFQLEGLSGDFHVLDGELKTSEYQIINIIGKGEKPIGVWTPTYGITKDLNHQLSGLRAITWPGDSHVIPKGWETPTNNKNVLRVGVPAKPAFGGFIEVNIDPETQQVIVTGFCVEFFNAVIDMLPYAVKHEFIPFTTLDVKRPAGSYNDLLRDLSIGIYDAVVGDVTILETRSDYVDFALPYTEAGVSMIVRIKDERKSAWIFMKPFEKQLWMTTAAFFMYTGIVIWVVEHRVNEEFRGPPHKQAGMIFWFSFSTIVFAHREKLISNLSRFVVIVWVFVVLVLTSSYTASLASLLTVQQLRPMYTNIDEILRNGKSVGYQDGSFVGDMLRSMGFDDSKLKKYNTFEQYNDALQAGSEKGGVSAIIEELPYIRSFLAKYCAKYTMTSLPYSTAGFGFAFPKGSSLVHDVSRAVLQVTEEQTMNITNRWFGNANDCDKQEGAEVTSGTLALNSFKGLFLIAGLSSTSGLVFFLIRFSYENIEILVSSEGSMRQKLVTIAKIFDMFKDDDKSKKINTETPVKKPDGPIVDSFHEEKGVFSNDEAFYTIEVETQLPVLRTTTNQGST